MSATRPDLVLTRLIDAPRERVWKAWTDPLQFAQWWGPHHFTCPVCEIKVRPGGKIYLAMQGPDGSPFSEPLPMGGEFLEVVPPDRLVFTALAFPDGQGGWKLDNLNTVVLAGMQEGWSQSLEKLALLAAA
jgi:uncharacterized protein YndB with AHSA1/START domain